MPRVYLSEQDRLNARLASWVYGEMKLNNVSQRDLAKARGISQPAISQKLRARSFDFEDLVCFVKMFNPSEGEVMRLIGYERNS